MTEQTLPLTRRRVLAGLAGASTLGSVAGAFTSARLGDRELLQIGATAGTAGISVDCDEADCSIEDGALTFAFDAVPGETRRRSFTISVDDNPVRVWARTDCPPESDGTHHWPPEDWAWHGRHGQGSRTDGPPENWPGDRPDRGTPDGSAGNQTGGAPGNRSEGPPGNRSAGATGNRSSRSPDASLRRSPDGNGSTTHPDAPSPTFGGDWSRPSLHDALELRVSIVNPCGSDGTRLFPEDADWGPLRDFQTAFANGRRLDASEPCFESGDDVCLELEYRLPWWYAYVGQDDEAELQLELYAEQCRHVDESSVTNPFEPAECGSDSDPEPCLDCTKLGKLEVENDRLETAVYDFDELYGQFADDEHEYSIEVLEVTNKDDGEPVCVEVALLRDGQESLEMCEVRVKGGNRGEPSEHDPWEYDVDPPATRTSSEVCTGQLEAGNSGSTHQPGISYVEVFVCADGTRSGGGDE